MNPLFEQQFEDTYGHRIQAGNLKFTVENGYAAQ